MITTGTAEGMKIFWEECQNNNYKLGIFPEINPDGIALLGMRDGYPHSKILVENISTGNINLQKINGGKWINTTAELSSETLEVVSMKIVEEVALYALRNSIDFDIPTLIYNSKGIGSMVIISSEQFSVLAGKDG